MSIEAWAESLQGEVFNYWRDHYRDWEAGFRVFYGPVMEEPELLILGYQPGGGEGDFARDHLDRYSKGDFSPPDQHEYLTKTYRIARVMREKVLAGHEDLLENSVKSNAIFFRAKDIDQWQRVPDEKRREMEKYSLSKVEEMIERLNPNAILVEGMATWDLLRSRLGFEGECLVRRSNARLLCRSEQERPAFVGIIHPSTRVSDENWQKTRSKLLPLLRQ